MGFVHISAVRQEDVPGPACDPGSPPSAPSPLSRSDKCDDYWRYDPRITGSFDDDPEPPRDAYGEDADRRSVHSEHSARSLRSVRSLQSQRSSLSAHSHQVTGGLGWGAGGALAPCRVSGQPGTAGTNVLCLLCPRVRFTGTTWCRPMPTRPRRRAPFTVVTRMAPTAATSTVATASQTTVTPPTPAGTLGSKVRASGVVGARSPRHQGESAWLPLPACPVPGLSSAPHVTTLLYLENAFLVSLLQDLCVYLKE